MYAIIPLILIIIFFLVFVFVGIFTKTVIDKKTLIYTLPLFLIGWHLYSVGYVYVNQTFGIAPAMECLVAALKSFAFDVKKEFVQSLGDTNTLYLVDVYLCTILSGLTIIFSALGFFKVSLSNFFKIIFKATSKNVDIVYGYNEDAFAYCKNQGKVKHAKVILWVDANVKKLSNDDKKRLFLSNITYIHHRFTAKILKRYLVFARGTTHVICFQKNNEQMSRFYQVLDDLNVKEHKPMRFHIQCTSEYLSFVNQQLDQRTKNKPISAVAFDYYELIGRSFSSKYNLAHFLPKGFIKNAQLDSKKTVSVVMLGFGKTSYAILKALLTNNQFVTTKNGKLMCNKVQYYIYDKEASALKRNIVGLFNYANKQDKNNKEYFPPYELPGELHLINKDIKVESPELMIKAKPNANEYVYFVIGMPNNMDTLAITKQLASRCDSNRVSIFYNVDNKEEELVGVNNCYPFGHKNHILCHEKVANDELFRFAAKSDAIYWRWKCYDKKAAEKKTSSDFMKLSTHKKLSNIYQDINMQFKLNVLGYDFMKESGESVSKKEFMKTYDPNWTGEEYNYDKYTCKDYMKPSIRTTMAFQEHLRWVAFHIVNGWQPLKRDDISYVKATKSDGSTYYKVTHQDEDKMLHADITSFLGVEEVNQADLALYHKHKHNIKYNEVETYRFDYMLIDNLIYDVLIESGYRINKLN